MGAVRNARTAVEVLTQQQGKVRNARTAVEVITQQRGLVRDARTAVEVLTQQRGKVRDARTAVEALLSNSWQDIVWGVPLNIVPPLPAGLIYDFQAGVTPALQSAGGSPAVADNDPVGVWTEAISGAVASAAGSARPLLKKSVYNGNDCLRFDGSDDQLIIPGSSTDEVPNVTIFLVFKSSGAGGRVILAKSHTNGGWSSPYCRWILYNDGGYNTRWNGNNYVGGTWSTGDLKVLEYVDADVYANGTKVVDGPDADLSYPNGHTPIYISGNGVGSERGYGDYCRIMIWNRSLDAVERSLVRVMLGSQYAVTVTP
jgi:hypothetical protein